MVVPGVLYQQLKSSQVLASAELEELGKKPESAKKLWDLLVAEIQHGNRVREGQARATAWS